MDEDPADFDNIHMSALKVLSFMDKCNMDWTADMTDELMNVDGMTTLISYVAQDQKEWPKLLSLHVLHMIAKKRVLTNVMLTKNLSKYLM